MTARARPAGSPARSRLSAPLLLCLGLVCAIYAPFLLHGMVQIHGDGVVFSVPMLHLLKQSLASGHLPVWSDLVYGGHPVLAEGQMGTFNPLTALVAVLFEPLYGHTLHHFLGMLLTACGAYLLARELRAGPAAAGLCAVALTCSPLWIGIQNNLTIASTSSWVPWVLLAFERWLRTLDYRPAAAFGALVALMVVSGYPQVTHGTAVYLAVRLAGALLYREDRARLGARPRVTAAGLAMMVALPPLLAAAQLLPLAELAQHSFRSAGTTFLEAPAAWYLRGLLFTFADPADLVARAGPGSPLADTFGNFNLSGSVIVCLLAACGLLWAGDRRIGPHLAATLVVLNLGFSSASPLWRLVYEHGLLPGIRYFRVMAPYFNVALCGMALLAALSLERLAQGLRGVGQGAGLAAIATGVAALALGTHNQWVSAWQYVAPAVLLLALGVARFLPRTPVATAAFAALVLEVLMLRLGLFAFHAPAVLARPPTADLHAREDYGYRHFDGSLLVLYAQQNALSPRVAEGLSRSVLALTPTTCVMWGVASMHGGMALDLERRRRIEPLMIEEITDPAVRHGGTRLIDTLSVRFVSSGAIAEAHGMPIAFSAANGAVTLARNDAALPRFRGYAAAVAVDSLDAGIAALARTPPDTLIVECGDAAGCEVPATPTIPADRQAVHLTGRSPARYEFVTDFATAGWLFVADANYPGWVASIDGKPAPVMTAQLLGKAVAVGAGRHVVELKFRPRSLRLGLAASAIGLCLLVLVLVRARPHPPVRDGD